MIEIDGKQIKRLEKDLKLFVSKAYPRATKAALDKTAFNTRAVGQTMVRSKMITRNKWTEGSIRVQKARFGPVETQEARTGSTEEYLEHQEFGKTKRAKPIPTPYASNETALPRRRLPSKAKRFGNINLPRGRRPGKSRKARNRAAVDIAAQKKGVRYIYLELGRRSGIFRVLGGKKKPRLRKIYETGRTTITIKPRPWLGPATDRTTQQIPSVYRNALEFQLRKHKVLSY